MKAKHVLLLCLLILVASLLTACSQKVLLPPGDETEFALTFRGEGSSVRIEFSADDGQIHEFNTNEILWYYDRPEGAREYAVVSMSLNEMVEDSVTFHLLESKKPK